MNFEKIFIYLFFNLFFKAFLMESKELFMMQGQFYGCWWPDYTRSQESEIENSKQKMGKLFQRLNFQLP